MPKQFDHEKINFRLGRRELASAKARAAERHETLAEYVRGAIETALERRPSMGNLGAELAWINADAETRAELVQVCVRVPVALARRMKVRLAELEAAGSGRQVWPTQYIRMAVILRMMGGKVIHNCG